MATQDRMGQEQYTDFATYLYDGNASQRSINVFLASGIKLSGHVTDVHEDFFILMRGGSVNVIRYAAIATLNWEGQNNE